MRGLLTAQLRVLELVSRVRQLLESPKVGELFPPDVVDRARRYLGAIPGGTGAYSDSRGAGILRQEVSKARHGACA